MSGHSKWSTIKHKKGKDDARRGKVFTKIIKEMTVAARTGGGSVDANPRLRAAVVAAKAANMPADNITRAIQRGTGELDGITYDEITYEAYGPGGVALMIEVMTDNRNRTTPEIRHMLGKHGGNLGETGSVGWIFERKGQILVDRAATSEDTLMDLVLEAGADDMAVEDEFFVVTTTQDSFAAVRDALEGAGIAAASSELAMVPQTYVPLEDRKADQMIKLMDALEDHDDVQKVWANFDVKETAAAS